MVLNKNNNLSYWELKHYFAPYDLIVVGAGIVGLNAALSFKQKHKRARVLILEKGIFPEGASTKNAGFACFGSPGELLADLKNSSEKTVLDTLTLRWKGLKLLRKRLGDKNIDFRAYGGYELFRERDKFTLCFEKLNYLNQLVFDATGNRKCYSPFNIINTNFSGIRGIIRNRYEGQIDTGLMMQSLSKLVRSKAIEILYNITVTELDDSKNGVALNSNLGVFRADKVIIATNGFAGQLLKIKDVNPARAQVLITKPISSLKIKGTFHLEEGYYYFRNIDDRILLGGGRHLDFKKETTTSNEINTKIQSSLEKLLRTVILPDTEVVIDLRWTGIMGVGKEKKPIVRKIKHNCVAAVRMGGMGIAIGSLVGDLAAKEISE